MVGIDPRRGSQALIPDVMALCRRRGSLPRCECKFVVGTGKTTICGEFSLLFFNPFLKSITSIYIYIHIYHLYWAGPNSSTHPHTPLTAQLGPRHRTHTHVHCVTSRDFRLQLRELLNLLSSHLILFYGTIRHDIFSLRSNFGFM